MELYQPKPISQPPVPEVPQTGMPPADMLVAPGPVQSYGDQPKGHQKLLLVTVGSVVILFVGAASVSYALAYDYLPLKIPALQKPLANFFMGLPFTPKTAPYIIAQATIANKAVKRVGINASIAIKSDQFSSVLGLNELDAQVIGHLDSADNKNPKFDLHIDVTKQFNMDIRKKDAIVYFKINQLPGLFLPFLGIDPAKVGPVLDNWVAYDTTPLQTDARKYLESSNTTKDKKINLTEQYTQLINDDRVKKVITISSDTLEGVATYKIHFAPTPEVIDLMNDKFSSLADKGYFKSKEKLSDTIKQFTIDAWFDKKDSYTRKLVVAIDAVSKTSVIPSSAPILGAMTKQVLAVTDSKAKISAVVSVMMADFGKDFIIDVPAKSIKPEAFLQLLMAQSSMYGQGGLGTQVGKAEDTQRKNDLALLNNAIQAYFARTGRYPNSLSDIVRSGDVGTLPKDPKTKAAYQYTVTNSGKGFTLKATLSDGQSYTLTEKGAKNSLLQ